MPIKPGETNWIHNPIKYVAEDLLTRKQPGKQVHMNEAVDVVEIPYRSRKIIKKVLLALIPEKESKSKIDAFLKGQETSSTITVNGPMNLVCSFLYHLVDHKVAKGKPKTMGSLVIRRFKFLRNGKELRDGSIENIFKPRNQKKKPSQVKSMTGNRGARLPVPTVIDKIFILMKGKDAKDVKNQLDKWFSTV